VLTKIYFFCISSLKALDTSVMMFDHYKHIYGHIGTYIIITETIFYSLLCIFQKRLSHTPASEDRKRTNPNNLKARTSPPRHPGTGPDNIHSQPPPDHVRHAQNPQHSNNTMMQNTPTSDGNKRGMASSAALPPYHNEFASVKPGRPDFNELGTRPRVMRSKEHDYQSQSVRSDYEKQRKTDRQPTKKHKLDIPHLSQSPRRSHPPTNANPARSVTKATPQQFQHDRPSSGQVFKQHHNPAVSSQQRAARQQMSAQTVKLQEDREVYETEI